MRKTSLTLVTTSLALLLQAAPVQAQASRTWVSGVGDDANPCSRTAPCKTFAGAISKTALNGEINCLDPGGFGAVTITKSITIDCHEVFASILNAGTNGINIPFDSFNQADVRKTVRVRNINFNGVNTGVIGIRITGGAIITGGAVFIEDCLIDGNFGGTARGISEERTGGGELFISNTTVRNMGQTAIQVNGFIQCNAATEKPPNIVGFHAGTRPYVRNASYSASRTFKYVFSRSVSPMKTAAPRSCCQKTTATPHTSSTRTMARDENSCSCARFLVAGELNQDQRESILARPIRST